MSEILAPLIPVVARAYELRKYAMADGWMRDVSGTPWPRVEHYVLTVCSGVLLRFDTETSPHPVRVLALTDDKDSNLDPDAEMVQMAEALLRAKVARVEAVLDKRREAAERAQEQRRERARDALRRVCEVEGWRGDSPEEAP